MRWQGKQSEDYQWQKVVGGKANSQILTIWHKYETLEFVTGR